MDEIKELVVIEKMDIVSFFTKHDDMDKILLKIRETVLSEIQSVETAGSRKAIASMAYKVSQSKTMLDNAGKDLVSEAKTKIKKIDIARKKARDYLDALRDDVRKPLTQWELAEKEKKEAEENRLRQIEIQKARDEQIRKEAAEAVLIQAEKEKIAAMERAKIEQEIAVREERRKIEEDVAKARAAEQAEADKLKAAAEKKTADVEHQKKINNTIAKGMMEEGITEIQAKKIIKAIFNGKIKYVTINY